jgi:hypothetical protein
LSPGIQSIARKYESVIGKITALLQVGGGASPQVGGGASARMPVSCTRLPFRSYNYKSHAQKARDKAITIKPTSLGYRDMSGAARCGECRNVLWSSKRDAAVAWFAVGIRIQAFLLCSV